MQYTIWIIPPEPLYTQLTEVIKKLAAEFDGPVFEPHLTLLGNIDGELSEIEQKASQLAKTTGSLELSLGPVSFSTTYFQSVFVRVKSTAQLLQLNLDAKKLCKMENTVYMPHISLLYGEHPMSEREKAAAQIELPESAFVVKELTITPATLDPSLWVHSATIPLGL